jgi:archaemetzincin
MRVVKLRQFIIILIYVLFNSCLDNDELTTKSVSTKSNPLEKNKKLNQDKNPKNKTIYILPLGNVPVEQLKFVQSSIAGFFGYTVLIENKVSLSPDLKNNPPIRYVADKILAKFNTTKNRLILTNVDIVTHDKKRKVKEWGVLGLGYRPGNTCVVSTFRLNKAKVKVSHGKFLERLEKVCIHEVGHNLGLPHCTRNDKCLMNDANGTIAQVDKETLNFCDYCRSKIPKLIK